MILTTSLFGPTLGSLILPFNGSSCTLEKSVNFSRPNPKNCPTSIKSTWICRGTKFNDVHAVYRGIARTCCRSTSIDAAHRTWVCGPVAAQDIEPEADTNSEEEEAFGDDFDDDDFEDDFDQDEDEFDEVSEEEDVADEDTDALEEEETEEEDPEGETAGDGVEEIEGDGDVSGEENTAESSETTEEEPARPREPIKNRLSNVEVGAAQAVYESLEKTVKHFETEASSVREQIRQLAERRYKERKNKIEGKYDGSINPLLVQERQARMDAIAAFERFLQRHPDNRDFTPDAIFRLAELQFERADEVYQERLADYRVAYNEYSAGRLPEEPEEPEQRFDRTIELYRWLVKDFPDYRFVDGAYYLLGYALQSQGEGQEGIKAWEVITQKYPESRFFDEVAFRVGDNYFQEEVWEKAIEAFLLVAPKKESRFYDKALYNWHGLITSLTVSMTPSKTLSSCWIIPTLRKRKKAAAVQSWRRKPSSTSRFPFKTTIGTGLATTTCPPKKRKWTTRTLGRDSGMFGLPKST